MLKEVLDIEYVVWIEDLLSMRGRERWFSTITVACPSSLILIGWCCARCHNHRGSRPLLTTCLYNHSLERAILRLVIFATDLICLLGPRAMPRSQSIPILDMHKIVRSVRHSSVGFSKH